MHAKTAQFERSCLDLAAIYEICRILGASSDARRSFRAALNVLSAHLDLHRLMVVAVDDDGQLFTLSFVGLTSEHAERGHWKPGEGIIGTVFTTGMALVVPGVRDSPEFLDRTGAFGAKADERHAFIVVPLKTDKHVLRVLAAQRRIEGLARRRRRPARAAQCRDADRAEHAVATRGKGRTPLLAGRDRAHAEATAARAKQGITDVVGNDPRMQVVQRLSGPWSNAAGCRPRPRGC